MESHSGELITTRDVLGDNEHALLCEVCKGFWDCNPHSKMLGRRCEGTYIHHRNLITLGYSAQTGCQMCKILYGCLKDCKGFGTALAEAEKLELRRGSLLSSDLGFDWKRDTDEVEEITRSVEAAEIARSVAEQHESEQHEKVTKLETRSAKLGPLARSFYKVEGYDEVNTQTNVLGRIVIRFSGVEMLPKPCFQSIDVRVSGPYFSALQVGEGIRKWVEVLVSTEDEIDPGLNHRPSTNILSGPHLDLIQRWRDECRTNHEACGSKTKGKLPNRVVEILSANGGIVSVQVIETRGMRGHYEYACLSYCWGSSAQAGMTTTGNFPRPLKLEELPKTITDTILLCSKLGFQYLWVDSLCIIQNDINDWQNEASKMQDIYGGSSLTIATPICYDSSQSLISQRLLNADFPEPRIRLDDSNQTPGKPASIWRFYRHPNLQNNGMWCLELEWRGFKDYFRYYQRDTWMKRAWTFQEWMLSPKVLHINKMTFWDCFEGYGNEISSRQMEPAKLQRNVDDQGNEISWKNIVTHFTSRKITKNQDRLPALAGIADLHRKKTGYTYLAGIWLEDIPSTLLWHRADQDEASVRSSGYTQGRIPSWSWASVETRVDFRPGHHTRLVSVTSWLCEYDPPGSLVDVTRAWIELKGSLTLVTGWHYEGSNCYYTTRTEIRWHNIWLDDDDFDIKRAVTEHRIYFILVAHSFAIEKYALIIEPTSAAGGGRCFRRVGLAQYSFSMGEWEEKSIFLM